MGEIGTIGLDIAKQVIHATTRTLEHKVHDFTRGDVLAMTRSQPAHT